MTPSAVPLPVTHSGFRIETEDPSTQARAGKLHTAHGIVETPVFMPVATQGTLKAMTQEDMDALGVNAILANAYHLYLRPGTPVIEKAGGLHAFMNYSGAILTDSGGFQVYSLADLREVNEEGVTFKSHHDGSLHTLTPGKVIEIQAALGSDIWTSLDECPGYPCDQANARQALKRTMRWTEASARAFELEARKREKRPLFFPILQGSVYPELRREGAEHMMAYDPDGISIGGFSVGEPKDLTWEVLARTTEALPKDKARYLMGMGTPEDLWEAVGAGIDMMDCVWPTRVARHGLAMVRSGKLNLLNSPFREDFAPLDVECSCRVCKTHSRAYLSHLFRVKEISAFQLVSHHNVHFLMDVMRIIRSAIIDGRFAQAKSEFFEIYKR